MFDADNEMRRFEGVAIRTIPGAQARVQNFATATLRQVFSMDKHSKLSKVILYQNVGFLVIISLGFLDELVRLSSLIFRESYVWEFRKSTLGMLMVLGVWFLVSSSTRRILDRLRYLEKFTRVCAWCRHVDHKGEWLSLEAFLQQGFDTPTTHGICPKCLAQQKAALARAKATPPSAVVAANPK